MHNPFTPSVIASRDQDFFGRDLELRALDRALSKGSVSIQGAMGIGKSSLVARIRSLIESKYGKSKSYSIYITGHAGIQSADDAARVILEQLVEEDETSKSLSINIFKIVKVESKDVYKNFVQGRYLDVLTRLFEKKVTGDLFYDEDARVVIAIDEADKCPVPLARLIRVMSSNLQQLNINNVRFVVAGVNPYFREITNEDPGVARFFYKTVLLSSLSLDESIELLDTKFLEVIKSAQKEGISLRVDDRLSLQLAKLSGGHPHLLQLLGSHLIEREEDDPDGVLDSRDLANALKTICYEDRSHVYESLIHLLEVNGKYDVLKSIIQMSRNTFPTIINRRDVEASFDVASIHWLIDNNVIYASSDMEYGLIDEFFRIRLIMDDEEKSADDIEKRIIADQSTRYLDFDRDDYSEPSLYPNVSYDTVNERYSEEDLPDFENDMYRQWTEYEDYEDGNGK